MSVLASRRGWLVVGVGLLAVIAIVGGLLLRGTPTEAAQGRAVLVVLRSQVQVQASGHTTFVAGRSGQSVYPGDTVRTGSLGLAAIQYADGSMTRLGPGSAVKVAHLPLNTGAIEINQNAGDIWNRVASVVHGGGFKVHEPYGTTAEVRGTEFSIKIYKDSTGRRLVRVDVWFGLVAVSSHGRTVMASTGMFVLVGPNGIIDSGQIPESDKRDSFTVLNQTLDDVAGQVLGIYDGTASEGEDQAIRGTYLGHGTDVTFLLGWPGSTFQLDLQAPAGYIAASQRSSHPPLGLTVFHPADGYWTYVIHDIHSSPHEAFWLIISEAPDLSAESGGVFGVTSGPSLGNGHPGGSTGHKPSPSPGSGPSGQGPGTPSPTPGGQPAATPSPNETPSPGETPTPTPGETPTPEPTPSESPSPPPSPSPSPSPGPVMVTLLNPVSGPTAGGNRVHIRGLNMSHATSVTFGGTPYPGRIVSASDTELEVVAPAHPAGAVFVIVTTSAGFSQSDSASTYLYTDGGKATSISTLQWLVALFTLPLGLLPRRRRRPN